MSDFDEQRGPGSPLPGYLGDAGTPPPADKSLPGNLTRHETTVSPHGVRGPRELTIIGAGPVGCVLALLLAKKGKQVRLIEKRTELPSTSMAIGITPPSLEVLDHLGVGETFRSAGVLIPAARVFEEGQEVGVLDFRTSEDQILSLPQFGTLKFLRDAVRRSSTIQFEEGLEMSVDDLRALPGWIIGCDGSKSTVRQVAGISDSQKNYPSRFVMADFPDLEDLGPEARLYFSASGAVESFPLPGGMRRWVSQRVGDAPGDLSTVIKRVFETTGIDLSERKGGDPWAFQPERMLAETFASDPYLLCGDAAHTLSPIGGQGMNTGIADARLLSDILENPTPTALECYTLERQAAFRIAARRAATGMWLGTRTGVMCSRVRKQVLRAALALPGAHEKLVTIFSMKDLPASGMTSV